MSPILPERLLYEDQFLNTDCGNFDHKLSMMDQYALDISHDIMSNDDIAYDLHNVI